ncbi:hypothetical protein OC842_003089 [Tilletia horrida]|uniref:Uncharacterized protein n=1 Tax=Tilletia horrida TaxID=155126 RepID=A0AAN6GET6_9BASI|nr:hypothetical protein OC842_003089 [Tilletia horrida]KAK0565572.1 hypothetical protein OC844_001162 [Tilletia horrida]
MVNAKLASSLFLFAAVAIHAVVADDPAAEDCATGITWFQTSKDIAADNSTVTLNEGGQGNIAALGDFYANSGVRWNTTAIEVGFAAGTNSSNTLGGGYTVTPDGITVGAGITYQGRDVDFSLSIGNDGTVAASLGGKNLQCTVDGSRASCA